MSGSRQPVRGGGLRPAGRGAKATGERRGDDGAGFSAELRRKAAPLWQKEMRHPFVVGIGRGTLPVGVFRYYMGQDYVFLIEYCRVMALAAAKATATEDMGWFARLLDATLNTEMGLHVGFCKELDISEEELRATRPSPTTAAYTAYLLRTAYAGDAGEIAAAVLPCQWGYAEIGRMLHRQGPPAGHPLYTRWIEMYSSPEFGKLAAWLRSFVDRSAAASGAGQLGRMEEAFLTSSRHEYMFWDAALRMEEWPL